MAATNDVTGDSIITKPSNKAFEDGWDRIFGKKQQGGEDGSFQRPDTESDQTQDESV